MFIQCGFDEYLSWNLKRRSANKRSVEGWANERKKSGNLSHFQHQMLCPELVIFHILLAWDRRSAIRKNVMLITTIVALPTKQTLTSRYFESLRKIWWFVINYEEMAPRLPFHQNITECPCEKCVPSLHERFVKNGIPKIIVCTWPLISEKGWFCILWGSRRKVFLTLNQSWAFEHVKRKQDSIGSPHTHKLGKFFSTSNFCLGLVILFLCKHYYGMG